MKDKLKPRVDRFINFMEGVFGADDIDLLYETYDLLKKGKVTFWEIIKPYLKVCIRDGDLITRCTILNKYLVVRLGYANGKDKIKGDYSMAELKFILDDFEKITGELKDKIGEDLE